MSLAQALEQYYPKKTYPSQTTATSYYYHYINQTLLVDQATKIKYEKLMEDEAKVEEKS